MIIEDVWITEMKTKSGQWIFESVHRTEFGADKYIEVWNKDGYPFELRKRQGKLRP